MSFSFRDPAGKVFLFQEQIYRAVNRSGSDDFRSALKSPIIQNYLLEGSLVGVSELENEELNEFLISKEISEDEYSFFVKHKRISFRSYPYEWTTEMLHSAGILTLKLAKDLLGENLGLKDATPYNILFEGTQPIFVDWLSFEKRTPTNPIWLPQSQFLRTFYLPLMANKYFGLNLSGVFQLNRDGLEPEEVYQLCSIWQRLLPPFLTQVTIPRLLSSKSQKSSSIYKEQNYDDPEKANFVLSSQFNSLERLMKRINPNAGKESAWSDYVGDNQHFTNAYFARKEQFVGEALAEFSPSSVLDIGCNTGHFSRIAAKSGAKVVSIDSDPVVVSKVWQMATSKKLDILPLVVDICRPTPAIGWHNEECPSFIERMKGRISGILMLAVIHHMLVSEGIPLNKIIELAAELTDDIAIIEFVPPDDPMFKQIARGRDHLYENLNGEVFRQTCLKSFKIVRSEKLPDSDRELYLLKK